MSITDIDSARPRRGRARAYVPTQSVEVVAVVDLEQGPIGTRLLIDGELYEVVSHPGGDAA